jgi:hypothetical protein
MNLPNDYKKKTDHIYLSHSIAQKKYKYHHFIMIDSQTEQINCIKKREYHYFSNNSFANL